MASLFLSVNIGIIFGISLASFGVAAEYLWALIFIFIFKRRPLKVVLFFILFVLLGFWRYETYQAKSADVDLSKYNGHKVVLLARVNEEVDPGGNYQKAIVKAFKVDNKATSGLALVTLPKFPELKYGDVLELSGNLEAPDNWSEFKYDRYLARYDIYSLVAFPKLKIIGKTKNFYGNLLYIKYKVYSIINSALPEPEAGLANALLLGYKGTLDGSEKAAFSCCGLSHIVAISGSHLTLLSALAFDFLLLFGLSRRQSFGPAVIFLWFYTILTGLQTSALRASIMGHLTIWGQNNGRQDSEGRLLFCAAAVMLLINPLILRDDLGFQLSFLAMIALIYFCPLGEKLLGKGSIKSIIILTLAAQLLTWPISALNFGRFSIIAPLANLLVVWIFALLLPALLISTFLSWILPALNIIWFAPSYFMLRYVNLMGDWLATWPKACLDFTINPFCLITYYLILAIIYCIFRKKIDTIK